MFTSTPWIETAPGIFESTTHVGEILMTIMRYSKTEYEIEFVSPVSGVSCNIMNPDGSAVVCKALHRAKLVAMQWSKSWECMKLVEMAK